jgi:hypothetical protein
MKDKVIFRKWKDTGDVIALFPEQPADCAGRFCNSYEHVGQHGGADYYGVIQQTRPASKKESAPLARELRRIGYKLQPMKRASRKMHDACRV